MENHPISGKIEAFLLQSCFVTGGFDGEGGGLVLYFRDPTTKNFEVVREYPVKPNSDPANLANAIALDADMEAEGNGNGRHQFTVHALRQGEKRQFARRTFSIVVETDEARVEEDTTVKGQLAQTQRHLEAMARMFTQALPQFIHGYERLAEQKDRVLERLEKSQMETLNLYASLSREKATYDAERMKEERAEARKDMIVGKITEVATPLLLPKVIEALTPREKAQAAEAIIVPNGQSTHQELPRVPELPGGAQGAGGPSA